MVKKIIFLTIVILCIGYSAYAFLIPKESDTPLLVEKKEEEIVVEAHPFIWIDIKGAVQKPGVYEVEEGIRVAEVIEKAGGLLKGANTDFLNMSRKVEDGDVIWIYTEKEIEEFKEGKTKIEYIESACHCPDVQNSACISNTEEKQEGKVNINTATKEELMTLSGIGAAKALAIIEYRKTNPFQKIEDIQKVSGIGESVYEKIKDSITI